MPVLHTHGRSHIIASNQGTCLTLREINRGHGLHWRNHMLLRSNQAWRMMTWPPEDPAEVPDQKKDFEMMRWHYWKCSVLIKSEKSVVLYAPPTPPPAKDTGIQYSWWEKVKVKVAQSCLTLCDPLDCSPWKFPGQNTGVGTYAFSSGSSRPRNWTRVSRFAGRFFTNWVIRETLMVRSEL